MATGGLVEATQRALLYVLQERGGSDERLFSHAWSLFQPRLRQPGFDFIAFRQRIRSQALLLRRNPQAALAALPQLLAQATPDEIRRAARVLEDIAGRGAPLSAAEAERLQQMLAAFAAAAPEAADGAAAAKPRRTVHRRGAE
jgi:hypothetical protein